MTTASEAITKALSKLRVLGFGESPTSAQAQEHLDDLNRFLNQLVGFGGSMPFVDIPVSSAYTITTDWPAVRVLCQHTSALTITLPQGDATVPVQDGFRIAIVDASGAAGTYNITVARNGWKIAAATANATISTNSDSRIYMFRADLGDWKLAADLALTDALPLPSEFDDAVILGLSKRIGGRYGQSLSREDAGLADDGVSRIYARYARPPNTRFRDGVAYIGGRPYGAYGSSYNWAADR